MFPSVVRLGICDLKVLAYSLCLVVLIGIWSLKLGMGKTTPDVSDFFLSSRTLAGKDVWMRVQFQFQLNIGILYFLGFLTKQRWRIKNKLQVLFAIKNSQRILSLCLLVSHLLYVLLQVGTAVVTGQNGRLAMGRLGSLCEQVNKYIVIIEEISKKKKNLQLLWHICIRKHLCDHITMWPTCQPHGMQHGFMRLTWWASLSCCYKGFRFLKPYIKVAVAFFYSNAKTAVGFKI